MVGAAKVPPQSLFLFGPHYPMDPRPAPMGGTLCGTGSWPGHSLVELGKHKAIFYNCLDLDITLCCAGAVLVLCLQTVNTTAIFN